MRTYHRTNRKEDILNTSNSTTSNNLQISSIDSSIDSSSSSSACSTSSTSINLNKTMLITDNTTDSDRLLNLNLKSKFLKCDICLEIFREKHHLSRHMTSHR